MEVINALNITKEYKIYNTNKEKLKLLINKRYKIKKFHALSNVSFNINKGEIIGIIGKNGAGKSTLLKILTGVAFVTYGKVFINGRVSSLLELGSGFDIRLTGYENIYFNATLNGLKRVEIDKKINEIIKFADIGDFLYQPVKNYSSGMFARLAFAVAININPDILIVDEILSVGDIKFQVKCMEKFEKFKKQGKTILYVSHSLATVKKFCNRVIWIDEGKVVEDGNPVMVVEKYFNMNFGNKNHLSYKEFRNDIIEDFKMNKISNEIDYLKNLEFKITYLVKNSIYKNVYMVIEIRKIEINAGKEYSQFVCDFNSIDSHKNIPFSLGKNTIYFNLKNLNLVSGIYYIDVVFLCNNEEIYKKIKAYNFTINDKYRGEGFIVLEHEWEQ
ncbi:ABC transporter ATP-binding protein [Sarcina ventriculi]|uniref:Teichoic acids export ATP-binding protein TagH n=1 Tax=Sarcina ventriculi TaxID=1267 RepID=A0ABM9USF2_SARVE|nr:ABC transporter ATP-binding protein [Sarcina ventriculi]MBU5323476.1 ATP-binding cassette domain-containing protein [Sarcina ventriculi]CUO22244.1 Teichoic acids export ATP-binding protein TagH [Sarcina ventriculi]